MWKRFLSKDTIQYSDQALNLTIEPLKREEKRKQEKRRQKKRTEQNRREQNRKRG